MKFLHCSSKGATENTIVLYQVAFVIGEICREKQANYRRNAMKQKVTLKKLKN